VIRPLSEKQDEERALTKGGEITGRMADSVRNPFPGCGPLRVNAKRNRRLFLRRREDSMTTLFTKAWRMNHSPGTPGTASGSAAFGEQTDGQDARQR